jgi:hypothetical protein
MLSLIDLEAVETVHIWRIDECSDFLLSQLIGLWLEGIGITQRYIVHFSIAKRKHCFCYIKIEIT